MIFDCGPYWYYLKSVFGRGNCFVSLLQQIQGASCVSSKGFFVWLVRNDPTGNDHRKRVCLGTLFGVYTGVLVAGLNPSRKRLQSTISSQPPILKRPHPPLAGHLLKPSEDSVGVLDSWRNLHRFVSSPIGKDWRSPMTKRFHSVRLLEAF